MNLRLDTRILKLWPKLVDHYRDALIEPMFREAKIQHDLSFKYSEMLYQFQTIADLLEKNGMTFKQIESFRTKPEVIKVIDMLQKKFSDELTELEKAE